MGKLFSVSFIDGDLGWYSLPEHQAGDSDEPQCLGAFTVARCQLNTEELLSYLEGTRGKSLPSALAHSLTRSSIRAIRFWLRVGRLGLWPQYCLSGQETLRKLLN